ncbi:hypothetical protein [Bacillus sp. MRMR6]|uniref:hypothetical protein n=1 Tax=Bacillus sp. MRMR6 TaxID=1928617 RepID=UPI0009524E52|nr:hypothetical protein [Bacillus sp. MRMR6]OLS33668.1 hypothetical protein BTR25_24585 [Bacillus sp. MRMR6]
MLFWQAFAFDHTVMMYELLEGEFEGKVPHYQTFVEKDFAKEVKTTCLLFLALRRSVGLHFSFCL